MIQLPTTALQVLDAVVDPAWLVLPAKMRGDSGTVLSLAIGGQESGYAARVQMGNGPAHSFWQMEKGGGVHGVMTHPASKDTAATVCAHYGVWFDEQVVWEAMATNDELGACFARLLLWTSTASMPTVGDQDGAYIYYTSLWRPGKPDPSRWPAAYQAAVRAVRG
jgi:hypothetical protein